MAAIAWRCGVGARLSGRAAGAVGGAAPEGRGCAGAVRRLRRALGGAVGSADPIRRRRAVSPQGEAEYPDLPARAHEDLVALLAEVDAVLAETTVEGTACVL